MCNYIKIVHTDLCVNVLYVTVNKTVLYVFYPILNATHNSVRHNELSLTSRENGKQSAQAFSAIFIQIWIIHINQCAIYGRS